MGDKLTNARAETISERASFRKPFQSQRCLIPADGFYEWKATPNGKQPFRFTRKDGGFFCMAGLWDKVSVRLGAYYFCSEKAGRM